MSVAGGGDILGVPDTPYLADMEAKSWLRATLATGTWYATGSQAGTTCQDRVLGLQSGVGIKSPVCCAGICWRWKFNLTGEWSVLG